MTIARRALSSDMSSLVARSRSWCQCSTILALVLAPSLALLAACGDDDGAAPSIDAAPAATSVTFRLDYRSDVPDSIFVQSGTEAGGQGWLTVRDGTGDTLAILDDCGVCNCDACDPCAVCGVGRPEVTEIPRDGHVEWSWEGTVFSSTTCATGGLGCEAATPPPAGSYSAHFCWSTIADGVGPDHHVGPLTCADQTFELTPAGPSPATVVHEECACG
jgi:hypothetical protein